MILGVCLARVMCLTPGCVIVRLTLQTLDVCFFKAVLVVFFVPA